jgi:5-methylcytosine-specific restriction endonuclease McrA
VRDDDGGIQNKRWQWIAWQFNKLAIWAHRRSWPRWSLHSKLGIRYHGATVGYRWVDLSREWREIVRRDPCPFCYEPSNTIDHVEPLSKGGRDSIHNVVGMCHRCNGLKSSQSVLFFLTRPSPATPFRKHYQRPTPADQSQRQPLAR